MIVDIEIDPQKRPDFFMAIPLFEAKKNKYGIIRKNGTVVIDTKYDICESFSEGGTAVSNDGTNKWYADYSDVHW